MSEKTEELVESIVDRKPSETAELFAESMRERIKEKILEHKDVVSENFFEVDAEEDVEEDNEEKSELQEISAKKLKDAATAAKNMKQRHEYKADMYWSKRTKHGENSMPSITDPKSWSKSYREKEDRKSNAAGELSDIHAAKAEKFANQQHKFSKNLRMKYAKQEKVDEDSVEEGMISKLFGKKKPKGKPGAEGPNLDQDYKPVRNPDFDEHPENKGKAK